MIQIYSDRDKGEYMGHYDEKVDVYAYAMTLYELSTCKPPFYPRVKDEDPFEDTKLFVFGYVPLDERPEWPTAAPAGYTESKLRALIEKCWKRDPKDRPSFHEIKVRQNVSAVVFVTI
jgi:serine/threonine protein kinase